MSDVKPTCEQGKTCPHCGGIHFGQSFCPMPTRAVPVAVQENGDAEKLKEWADLALRDPLNIELPKLESKEARELMRKVRLKMNELATALEGFGS